MRWVICTPHDWSADHWALSTITHWSESTLPRGPAVRDPVSQRCLEDQLWGIQLGHITHSLTGWGYLDSLDPSQLVRKATVTHWIPHGWSARQRWLTLVGYRAQWTADQSWGVPITHLTTETAVYILQAYIISLDTKWLSASPKSHWGWISKVK